MLYEICFHLGNVKHTTKRELKRRHEVMKHHLKSDYDIIRFFNHFERDLQGKQVNELNSAYGPREKQPRIKNENTHVGASKEGYTPVKFECFQKE